MNVCSTISELMAGPSQEAVKEVVTRLACEEGLVTPYTSRVGVMLQPDPLDPAKVSTSEIPIQVGIHYDTNSCSSFSQTSSSNASSQTSCFQFTLAMCFCLFASSRMTCQNQISQ